MTETRRVWRWRGGLPVTVVLTCLILGGPTDLFAQQGTITGTVIDAETHAPVETAVLFFTSTGTYVTSTRTNAQGQYCLPPGLLTRS